MKRQQGRVGARAVLVVIAGAGVAALFGAVACGQRPPELAQSQVREELPVVGRGADADASVIDDGATKAAAQSADSTGAPYRLNRTTWRITIDPRPIARTRCWLSVVDGGERDERVVEWDPSSSDAPERFVTLRRGESPALRCASEVVTVGAERRTESFTYVFDAPSPSLRIEGRLVGLTSDAGPSLSSWASATPWSSAGLPYSSRTNPSVSQGGTRSLDPLTPLFSELATVIAEIAVDRAKAGAQEAAKERLRDVVCRIGYGAEGSDDIKPIAGGLRRCDDAKVKSGTCSLVFKKTCASLDFLRLEELAASADAIGRALAGDLSAYAFTAVGDVLASKESDRVVGLTVNSLNRSLQGLIDGNAVRTEREFQTLLLGLAEVPLLQDSEDAERYSWRCAVGMGAAVLRECLERDVCSADALRTAFERELDAPSPPCDDARVALRRNWPELPGILARAVDVMRPPPGVSPNQTAKAATVIVLEILEKRADWYGARGAGSGPAAEHVRAVFDATKALSTALFDRDYAAAAVASARLVSSAVARCDQENQADERHCEKLDLAQLKRALALLNAFVSYAASYRKEPNGTTDGKSDAERERARRDERKRAMNDLVDAMADRSGRRGDVIFSLGVGVGFTAGRGRDESVRSYSVAPSLALPTGPSVDYLCGRALGLHLQVPLLDLGQFTTVSKDGELQDKPTFASAFLLGVQPGLLFFPTTKIPLVLAGDFGWAPGLKLAQESDAGVLRLGMFLGTYIPFIDFN